MMLLVHLAKGSGAPSKAALHDANDAAHGTSTGASVSDSCKFRLSFIWLSMWLSSIVMMRALRDATVCHRLLCICRNHVSSIRWLKSCIIIHDAPIRGQSVRGRAEQAPAQLHGRAAASAVAVVRHSIRGAHSIRSRLLGSLRVPRCLPPLSRQPHLRNISQTLRSKDVPWSDH